MQARLNIAKKSCIEIYKAINSLVSSKDEQYFINISETEHKNYFEDKMQQNIKNVYGMDNKDLVYSKNIKLLDDVYYWIINPIDDIENYIVVNNIRRSKSGKYFPGRRVLEEEVNGCYTGSAINELSANTWCKTHPEIINHCLGKTVGSIADGTTDPIPSGLVGEYVDKKIK